MTQAKKKEESQSTSSLIQFRWNSRDAVTGEALKALDDYEKNDPNFKSRGQFFAEAVLHFAGRVLPKRATNVEILTRLERIEQKQETAILLLEAFQNGGFDPSVYVNRENGRTLEDELGERIPSDVYEQMFSGVQGKTFDVD